MGKKEQGPVSLPRGVTVRHHKNGSTLVITFTYKGVLCREPLSQMDYSPRSVKYAERLLGEVQNRIATGDFTYIDYFPNSKKLALFGTVKKTRSVKEYLDEYITICENRGLSPSTIGGYRKCHSALKLLHSLHVTELTPAVLKNWITGRKTTLKTIRNNLSFLRSAVDEAVMDGLLESNPASVVSAARYHTEQRTEEESYEVDPFAPHEVSAICLAAGNRQWENLFRFAFRTGMRSSELCALRWSDIDFEKRVASVKNASVVGMIKGTKTRAGKRRIELDGEAMKALESQRPYTEGKIEFIFSDPKTGMPWAGADAIRKKAWVPTLKRSGIRYRNPYQTRHTFATMHISAGVNLFWLCRQMGHKGPEMLFRNYGSYLADYEGYTSRPSSGEAEKRELP